METVIRDLLRILCPHLKAMAANTSNPIDDIVVNIVCMIGGEEPVKKEDGGITL